MLHKRNNSNKKIVPNKGQRERLCSNNVGTRCPFLDSKKSKFSKEAIESFTNLAIILNKIQIRLIMEGYTITDDDIIPPQKQTNERPTNSTK